MFSATPSGAATTSPARVQCHTMTGAIGPGLSTFKLARCNLTMHTGGGGDATLKTSTTTTSTWTITWNTRRTTTIVFAHSQPSNVPGCPPGMTLEYATSGRVTADTTKAIPVGQRVSAVICERPIGRYRPISIPAGTTFNL